MRRRSFSITFFIAASLIIPSLVSASEIVITPTPKIEGKVIDQIDKNVIFSSGVGMAMVYNMDEINTLPKIKAADTIDIGHLRKTLTHLGYPPSTWPALEKELLVLFKKIDLLGLRQQAAQAGSDPVKLKSLLIKLGKSLEDNGYIITRETPHPLVQLLTTSLVDDNISQVIFSAHTSFWQKVDAKKALVACTAISQLGSILLDMLDIKVRAVFSQGHVFNCIPIDDQHAVFVDFSNQLFEIVDLNKYYFDLGGTTRKLKDQYHITAAREREINGQLASELASDPLEDILCFYYHYIYIRDDLSTTPAILLNLGNIYSRKGNFDQALIEDNKAIDIDPQNPEAYRERAILNGDKGDLEHSIEDFGKALELFPDFAEAYHDRAALYVNTNDMDKALSDLNQAIIIEPEYAEGYYERGKIYNEKGQYDKAIADFNKAIGIDAFYSDAYNSRAEAYFSIKDYAKAWKDIHQVQDFGDEANADLIDKLKKVTESRRFFLALLVAPIVFFLIFRSF